VALGGALGQIGTGGVRYRNREGRRSGRSIRGVAVIGFLKEPGEMRLDGKARLERVDRCVGRDVGRVDGPALDPKPTRRRRIVR